MKIFKTLLTKVESNHTRLRTNEVEGTTIALPEVGKSFALVGKSLTEGAPFRLVNTSEITEVEKLSEDELQFKTLNSIYKLKVLGTEEID